MSLPNKGKGKKSFTSNTNPIRDNLAAKDKDGNKSRKNKVKPSKSLTMEEINKMLETKKKEGLSKTFIAPSKESIHGRKESFQPTTSNIKGSFIGTAPSNHSLYQSHAQMNTQPNQQRKAQTHRQVQPKKSQSKEQPIVKHKEVLREKSKEIQHQSKEKNKEKTKFQPKTIEKSQPKPKQITEPEATQHHLTSNTTDEPNPEFTFAETFNIISEIQSQFENSLKENKKPISEIKRLIDNNLDLNNYILLSNDQQDNITKDIERSSELRIQNYTNVFKYIHSSLEGINECLKTMVTQDDIESNIEDEEEEDEEYVDEDDEDEMGDTAAEVSNTKDKKKHRLVFVNDDGSDEDCNVEESDFSAGVMLENALVLPPKSSPFNYQIGKDITRMRSKKFLNKKASKHIGSGKDEKKTNGHSHLNQNPNDGNENNKEKDTLRNVETKMDDLTLLTKNSDGKEKENCLIF